jgi:ribonucleoside-triphosphate reductase
VVNFFYTLQGEAAGAQAFSNFDTLLAPFIRYDGLDYTEVRQAIQEFIFNINIPTRVGFQTPFTNITMDLQPPKMLRDQPVIIGGRYQEATYGDFQAEMDLFNQAFAEVMMAGDANGRVFTFPIPTYNITADFDWDNPNLEPVWRMTAKYGIPYFSNFINSDMSPDDARSMCCRLRLDNRELRRRGGGLFGANPLTGSIGVVTINLPRIGYLADSEADFFNRLDRQVTLAAESLAVKRKVLENFTEKNLYPYSRFYLRQVKARTGAYWKNHFSTIGIIGMNEACLNFIHQDLTTDAGQDFALKVMADLRDRIGELQDRTGEIFNLEATPGEGTAYRLAMLDKRKFPRIVCAIEPAAGRFHRRPLRDPAPPGRTAEPVHRRHGIAHFPRGTDPGHRVPQAPGAQGGLQLPAALFHPHPHLQRLPAARLPGGPAHLLRPVHQPDRGLLRGGEIPSPRSPGGGRGERGDGSAPDLQPRLNRRRPTCPPKRASAASANLCLL